MAPILGYWPIRGLAQHIRFLLAYTKTEYEDFQYSSKESYRNEKEKLGLEFPNLPFYKDGDIKLTESMAILKYLARKTGLDGTCEEELIRIDLATGIISDIWGGFHFLVYTPKFNEMKDEYITNNDARIQKLSKLLGSRKFLAGNRITYMDFVLYELLEKYIDFIPKSLDGYANLLEYHKRISNLPAIKEYLASPAFQKVKPYFNGATGHVSPGKY